MKGIKIDDDYNISYDFCKCKEKIKKVEKSRKCNINEIFLFRKIYEISTLQ